MEYLEAKKIVEDRLKDLEKELFETQIGKKFETSIPDLKWLILTNIKYLCALEMKNKGLPVKVRIRAPEEVTPKSDYSELN